MGGGNQVVADDTKKIVVRDVPGWPGYKATSDGRVIGKLGTELSPWAHYRTGHLRVRLYGKRGHLRGSKGGMYADLYIHQIVCLTFHGPPPFDGAIVRHLDDIVSHNQAENLAWGDYYDNARDRWSREECLLFREERKAISSEDQIEYREDKSLGF